MLEAAVFILDMIVGHEQFWTRPCGRHGSGFLFSYDGCQWQLRHLAPLESTHNLRESRSQILINDYLKQLDIIKKVSGTRRETVVREAFKDLLKA